MAAWVWLVVAAVAFGVEMSRQDLYVLWFGIGALVAALFAPHLLLAGAVFLAVGSGLLWALRPRLARRLLPPRLPDPVEALVGREAVVLRPVGGEADFSGAVELDGRRYAARALDERTAPIPAGTVVTVYAIDGVRLVVHPLRAPAPPAGEEPLA
ncbi:Putative activity regulator of membrane protease YbbK [Candidatus Hydrogenisulfobacillus filiaventi]|uniref:Activity regulator of membrane protease YbbK n=1 Tax=Candidatus Hydrogenisulfobacillus filiaventi TaxID=2707344 RepID=A0A6F8ZCK5_9FIRM|nr:NfeD family protein [Bacillota bacterium]CAB1127661.1 Putative activity regulator of membrane protease YbbK [Candidatus Hydrogenisulfobacillus filiaventi]